MTNLLHCVTTQPTITCRRLTWTCETIIGRRRHSLIAHVLDISTSLSTCDTHTHAHTQLQIHLQLQQQHIHIQRLFRCHFLCKSASYTSLHFDRRQANDAKTFRWLDTLADVVQEKDHTLTSISYKQWMMFTLHQPSDVSTQKFTFQGSQSLTLKNSRTFPGL